jgi:hypothetical protein
MRLQTAQREEQNLASRQAAQSEPGSSSNEVEREGSQREMEAIHEQIRDMTGQSIPKDHRGRYEIVDLR